MSAHRVHRRLHLAGIAAVVAALALAPVAVSPAPHTLSVKPVRFGGRGFGFGSRPSLRRPVTGLGRRTPSRSRGLLRRIGHALAFAAVLHFLFAGSHGAGFVFLLLIIVVIVLLLRRRRRRAYAPFRY